MLDYIYYYISTSGLHLLCRPDVIGTLIGGEVSTPLKRSYGII